MGSGLSAKRTSSQPCLPSGRAVEGEPYRGPALLAGCPGRWTRASSALHKVHLHAGVGLTDTPRCHWAFGEQGRDGKQSCFLRGLPTSLARSSTSAACSAAPSPDDSALGRAFVGVQKTPSSVRGFGEKRGNKMHRSSVNRCFQEKKGGGGLAS